MDSLIPVINKLQDVFALVGNSQQLIDLPQIVVVGSQSSGKSSVLENIVGRDFLPRGSGIVTRRPLVLQLIHVHGRGARDESETPKDEEWGWGEFLHLEGKRFTDFSEIRDEIARETDRTTGNNKGISDKPIRLRIHSQHVVNLTLVDLPGITKVPVGDQPRDIEQQIQRMLLSYITNPNSIVLAVSAANTDLANSDALKLAKDVDPTGVRTLGVVTKLDLMDGGTDALDVLMGRVVPLRLGFIGVVNRSQNDINNNKPVEQSLEDEQQFFQKHPSYRSVAAKMGTAFLTKKLNQLLLTHIRECLPDIRGRVQQSISTLTSELIEYGDPVLSTKSNKGALLLQLLTNYSATFCDAIDGKSKELSTTELYGGARINFIFNDVFPHQLTNINPTEYLSVSDIRTAIRNATGTRQTLFVPEVSFELLAKQQIMRLLDPALKCCQQVYEEMLRIVAQCQPREMSRFANLRDRVVDEASGLCAIAMEPTKKMVENLIQIELAYINTSHPDFIGGSRAVAQLMDRQTQPQQPQQNPSNPLTQKGQQDNNNNNNNSTTTTTRSQVRTAATTTTTPTADSSIFSSFFSPAAAPKKPTTTTTTTKPTTTTTAAAKPPPSAVPPPSVSKLPSHLRTQTAQLSEHEKIVTEIIMTLLQSYFAIVLKNIQDSIPKAIMHFLVNQVKDKIQHQLVAALYKEEMLDELLEEADQISQRRQQCSENIGLLKNALDVLNQVKEASYK